MKELKPRIHENGIDYILVGDYYVPDLKLPEEHRPIGKWGNLHRAYLKQYRPAEYPEHHQLQKVDALQPLRLCPQRKGHSETCYDPDDQHQG